MIPSPPERPEQPPWFRIARLVGAAVLVLWIALIYIYYLRSNTGLLPSADRPLGVFGGLFGQWSFSLANTPPLEFAQALFALALTHGLGWLLLKALDVRAEPIGFHALAFLLGFGVSGIAIELLTMAGLLYFWALWPLWVALYGGAYWLWKRRPAEYALIHESAPGQEPDPAIPPLPESVAAKLFLAGAGALIALITIATFWHALFYPETYWDSLILYLGYGRMTFLEHAFPFKAEAQVGIGLGANYPHLFSNYGAMASTLFASWSDLPQRLAAPFAMAASTALVYAAALAVWRSHLTAAGAALLFRAVPYGIAYSMWASDYAFATYFCAAFLYAIVIYVQRPRAGEFWALTLLPAAAMHLNYLMGLLWVVWLVAVLLTALLSVPAGPALARLMAPLRSRRAWTIYLVCVALSLPWHIRNTVLTGNPVYAFFPEIFTASVRVNPEVLRSAELEWYRNGDGIARPAEFYYDLNKGISRDESNDDFSRQAGLAERLQASWYFWVGFDALLTSEQGVRSSYLWRAAHLLNILRAESRASGRAYNDRVYLLIWPHTYKMTPLMPAFFFPALALAGLWLLGQSVGWLRAQRREEIVLVASAAMLSAALLAYIYLLADFYLYQIIGIVAPASLVGGFLIQKVRETANQRHLLTGALGVLLLLQAVTPGLAFALMGFKFTSATTFLGQPFSQTGLDAFRNPGLDPAIFYRLRYGQDPDIWDYVNENLKGERLLTHENRHYVFDPAITLVHLDDWAMQQGWQPMTPQERYEFLREHDLRYYLRTENEFRHKINSRLGMAKQEAAGGLREIRRAGSNVLFEIVEPE